jgi:hypothetical protein
MKSSSLISVLEKYKQNFHPLVPFNAVAEKLLPLDFKAGNTE